MSTERSRGGDQGESTDLACFGPMIELATLTTFKLHLPHSQDSSLLSDHFRIAQRPYYLGEIELDSRGTVSACSLDRFHDVNALYFQLELATKPSVS